MYNFILISGSGIGAGKTSLALKLVKVFPDSIQMSLADGIRFHLQDKYPKYEWFNKSQEYKNTIVTEENKTIRELLKEVGQSACETDKDIWCRELLYCSCSPLSPSSTTIIDDVRKLSEVEFFKGAGNVLHFHVETAGATREEDYDNIVLASHADYKITWDC